MITAETTDGKMVTYGVDHWAADGSKFYEANGTAHDYSKGTITTSTRQGTVTATLKSYKITGIKYVPVAVDAADYQDFCKKYTVVKNGQSVQGGYGEQNLTAYTGVAAVDAATNGLKTVSKSGDAYAFSARQTGTGSGLLDQAQANDGTGVTTEVKKYSGSYGEFLRVDLNGTYGALGAAMQTVKWTYYGSDSTYTTPAATYGTKFAADNWMHKSNGIQLGLTSSVSLPAAGRHRRHRLLGTDRLRSGHLGLHHPVPGNRRKPAVHCSRHHGRAEAELTNLIAHGTGAVREEPVQQGCSG